MSLHEAAMLVAGEWRMRDAQPVLNPYDESQAGVRAHADTIDVADALSSAEEGGAAWKALGPESRAHILLKAAAILRQRASAIARIASREQGKPLSQARGELEYSAAMIEWDANEGCRLYGRIVPSAPGRHYAVYQQPIGVVAGFSPWNFPISSPTKKISAPLAAGCAVIIKASEETPGSATEVVRAFHDAGIPPGAINLLFGDPASISQHLIPDPRVRAITFTGSVAVGKHLSAMAGAEMKPALMELGGHAPVFISATADIARTAALSVAAKAINAGQVCVAPTRFFIEEAAYDEFATRMIAGAHALRYGCGEDPSTELGPLINARRRAAVEELIADARARGARLLSGGERKGGPGFGHSLTLLGDVPPSARAMSEEPFGPIALLVRVKDVEEAVTLANQVDYGLTGYAFTRSARDMNVLSERLEVGNLGINQFVASVLQTPFGGTKNSGLGRSGGREGLENFTEIKTVLTRFD